MVTVGQLVHIEERDLVAAQSVVFLQRAGERAEIGDHLSLGRDVYRTDSFGEGAVTGGQFEPVDKRCGRGQGSGFSKLLSAHPEAGAEAEKEFGMRGASGDFSGFLLVKAFGKLEPLGRIGASRVQSADRAGEFADLQEELRREGFHRLTGQGALANPDPEGMAAEGAPLLHHRKQIANESIVGTHSRPHARAFARGRFDPTKQTRWLKSRGRSRATAVKGGAGLSGGGRTPSRTSAGNRCGCVRSAPPAHRERARRS